ncbi:MAG: Fic family protein [Acidobacteriota bacterium]
MSAAKPWDDLINMADVLWLYAEGIKRFGGEGSPPKEGCLEQSLGNAYTAELYSESDSVRGLAFSGYLLFYLTRDHCFVDGNKRIAWTCCMRVLATLGLTVDASQEDAEALCMRIADSTLEDAIKDGSECVVWIAEHLVAIENQ